MTYNLDNLTNATTFYNMIYEVNLLTNSLYFYFILLVTFIIILVVFKNYDTKNVFIVDSFIVTIIAIFFSSLQLIGWTGVIVPIIMLVVSLIVKYSTDE